jgi:DNA gyrase subunit B
MKELIDRGHVYSAQPPLYRIKKGKFEQYIKNDQEFVRVMVKRAADGMTVRYGEGAARLEGGQLTKFMTTLNEYIGFLEKADKRIRDEQITEMLPKLDLSKRSDFEAEGKKGPAKLQELEKQLKAMPKNKGLHDIELRFDEEHELWEVRFVNNQGAEHRVSWELVSAPEFRQMTAKYKLIAEYLQPPFYIEQLKKGDTKSADDELSDAEKAEKTKAEEKSAKAAAAKRKTSDEVVEKTTVRELFDYVLNEGRKDYIIQRYKGLGEMSAEQLWETTMDPERRTLLSVKLEDLAETETIFSTLMGEDVEARRKFIEDNALEVKNLDI